MEMGGCSAPIPLSMGECSESQMGASHPIATLSRGISLLRCVQIALGLSKGVLGLGNAG